LRIVLVGEVPGVTGPGGEIAAGAGGRGRLRASRADREQVIEELKAAFVHERLDKDDFDLRVGQALASRTYGDLAALTADIPVRLTRARLPEAAREAVNKKNKKAVAAMAGATAAWIGTWPVMVLNDKSLFVIPVAVAFFILAMVVSTGWLVLLHNWLDQRADRPSAPGLPPGADGEASARPAPSGPAGQLPSTGHGRARDPGPGQFLAVLLPRWSAVT
jgi:Domain of unknown function (DUF1707)